MNTLPENPCAKAVPTPTRNPANRSERILVVEDNVAIRQLDAQVLVRSGWGINE